MTFSHAEQLVALKILKITSELEEAPEKDTHEYLNSNYDVNYAPKSSKSSKIFSTVWNGSLNGHFFDLNLNFLEEKGSKSLSKSKISK